MISAVILAKNEEVNIKRVINSVKWCDEVLIIDDGSIDKTVEIAKKMGTKIYPHLLNGDFAAQRNYGIEKARGEWVLFVDADEEVNINLAEEIRSAISKVEYDGYLIKRQDYFGGRWLNHGDKPRNTTGTGLIKLLRLAKKGTGSWKGVVHEEWIVSGKIGTLNNPLLHYPHQTIGEFIEAVNRFSTMQADIYHKEGQKSSFWQIVLYPAGKFIKNYFFGLGFLDGTPGFMVAMMMTLHSYLVRSKLYLLTKKR